MRIVFLNPTGVLGGGERSLLDLMASLRAAAPATQMHLIACGDGPLAASARSAGASAQVVPMPANLARAGDSGATRRSQIALRDLHVAACSAGAFSRRLADAITAAGPDIVHSNGIKTHLLTSMSRLDVPIVWHLRDFIGARPIVRRMLARGGHRRISIIAVSNAVADDAREWLQKPVHIDVVYNAIDTDHFSPGDGDGARLDRLSGLSVAPSDLLRVGLIATYARWKGQDLLLEAIRLLRGEARSRPARFYIVGGPIYRTRGAEFSSDELRAIAHELEIADCVGFIPFQDDPAPVYRALDMVIHASTRPEPFGRTIVEAMSCARPVISTRAGGAAELVRDGHDALTVPARDAPALARAIMILSEDANLRKRLAAAARHTAVTRFARQRLGPEVLHVYRRMLGHEPNQQPSRGTSPASNRVDSS